MSVDTQTPSPHVPLRLAHTSLAIEHWLESPSGFPPGSIGTVPPGPDPAVVSSARGLTLTRRQLDEVLAFTEFLAGRALPPADRAELEEHLVDAFDDSPKSATEYLRNVTGGVRRVSSLDPIERCQRRLQALASTYLIEHRRQADGLELSPIMSIVSRYNPMLRCWSSTGLVLVADALDARVELHALVLGLVDRPAEDPRALTGRLLARLDDAGRMEIAELIASQLRLLSVRAWLRDMGNSALDRLRSELAPAVASALDVDIVVQQIGFRAGLAAAQ